MRRSAVTGLSVMATYADYQAAEKFQDADAAHSETFDDPDMPRRRQRRVRAM
jgi:hypothetical protein